MNQFLLAVTLFAVAACTTPGAAPNRSEALQTAAAVPAQEPDDTVLASTADEKNSIGIEDIEAPAVTKMPAEMIPGRPAQEPAVVCDRVIPTGSVLPIEVCRNRVDIERKREADQEMFMDIKNNTAFGISRL